MDRLVQGVRQFRSNVFESERELFERLAGGQQPEALFITCSDSRIDPCLLTQTKPGDLFVLRNAGNVVPAHSSQPSAEAAAVEYAVKAIAVKHVVVCGHSQCGAMTGLWSLDKLDALPSVKAWVQLSEPARAAVEQQYPDASPDERLNRTIAQNVLLQLENLRTHPSVAEAVGEGRLELHGWVYRFETGDVFACNGESGSFASIQPDADEVFA